MRRDMIEQYGPLDIGFHPMYYEDVEWQYRLHRVGIRTVVSTRTHIIHREGSSAGNDSQSGMKRYQNLNKQKFLQRFQMENIEVLGQLR